MRDIVLLFLSAGNKISRSLWQITLMVVIPITSDENIGPDGTLFNADKTPRSPIYRENRVKVKSMKGRLKLCFDYFFEQLYTYLRFSFRRSTFAGNLHLHISNYSWNSNGSKWAQTVRVLQIYVRNWGNSFWLLKELGRARFNRSKFSCRIFVSKNDWRNLLFPHVTSNTNEMRSRGFLCIFIFLLILLI